MKNKLAQKQIAKCFATCISSKTNPWSLGVVCRCVPLEGDRQKTTQSDGHCDRGDRQKDTQTDGHRDFQTESAMKLFQ